MAPIGLGIQLWAQNTDWPSYLEAARLVDELLLVGANTFRNPTLTAKTIATIDHISGGRAIMGLGGAWHVREHAAFGVEFGSGFAERLDWLEEALQIIRPLLHGDEVTHHGPRYRVDHLRLAPPPIQAHLPIMVGGGGEKKTLRSVARHADMWNAQAPLEEIPRKLAALHAHCEDVGRDFATIELTYNCKIVVRDDPAEAQAVLDAQRVANSIDPATPDATMWAGTVEGIAERLAAFRDLGFTTFTIEQLAPFDQETLERLVGEVKPLLEQA
jgi:alkanesulfonate monooxygenase SsuD/methylene tetrahydromethanopterin reductase-like flavin-dependent oxidoreductase (luciferase family)